MPPATTSDLAEIEPGAPFPPLDVDEYPLVLLVGKKGHGKSQAARMYYGWWPDDVDRLLLDISGDADPGPDAQRISSPLPAQMPERRNRDEPLNLHYVPDLQSATHLDDMDRAVAMGLFPKDRRALLWVDEIHRLTPPNRTQPNTRLLLGQNRHHNCSALMCGPRPRNIDPLCIAQADRIHVFLTPLAADREHLADNAGIDRRLFEVAHEEARRRGRYWYVMYDAKQPDELFLCPPLPEEWRDITQA